MTVALGGRRVRSAARRILRSEVVYLPRFQAFVNTMALGVCSALVVAACGTSPKRTASALPPTPSSTVVVTTTTTPPVTYTVKRGDTLSNIAKRVGGTIEALVAANHLVDANSLTQGQVLVIPTPPPTTPTSSTTTLVLPTTTTTLPVVAGAPTLVLTPAHAQVGNVINFKLTGAKPSEAVTFEIDSPDGRKSTGQPHTAAADGGVTASYLTTQGNSPGQYTVIATGTKGTSTRRSFTIDPPA
jgi:LysM repeat protein